MRRHSTVFIVILAILYQAGTVQSRGIRRTNRLVAENSIIDPKQNDGTTRNLKKQNSRRRHRRRRRERNAINSAFGKGKGKGRYGKGKGKGGYGSASRCQSYGKGKGKGKGKGYGSYVTADCITPRAEPRTPAPTFIVTDRNTAQPTFLPTPAPVFAAPPPPPPPPTSQPTSAPTENCGISSSIRANRIITRINAIIDVLIGPNSFSSSRSQAFDWIINRDPLQLCPDIRFTCGVLQRFIMAFFYFEMNGGSWNQCSADPLKSCNIEGSRFLSEDDVCAWAGLECNIDGCLTEIQLPDNNLNGFIPAVLAALPNLRVIKIDGNHNIEGTIPPALGLIRPLEVLDLDTNKLDGTIPEIIFTLPNLKVLDLNDNHLNGTLSTSIGNLENLRLMQLDNNNFEGTIPDVFMNLLSLQFLTFSGNDLVGAIPGTVCALRNPSGLLQLLWADCANPTPKVSCTCCTRCFLNT